MNNEVLSLCHISSTNDDGHDGKLLIINTMKISPYMVVHTVS